MVNAAPNSRSLRHGLRGSERLQRRASGGGGAAKHPIRVVRPRVPAVVIEDPCFVLQHRHHAAVHHDAAIAARRELRGGTRSVDEVQVGAARVLVEAEGQLEFSRLHLDRGELTVIDVDVPPRIVGRDLVLDLVVGDSGDSSLDADTAPRDVEAGRIADLPLGVPVFPRQTRAEVDPRATAKVQGRVVLPAKAPVFAGRPVLLGGALVGNRERSGQVQDFDWRRFLRDERRYPPRSGHGGDQDPANTG